MAIRTLNIHNLRNIRLIEMDPSTMLNMIWGDNGSGKTSILESIYILCRGRSFRGLRAGPIIRNGEEYLQVFATTENEKIKSSIGIKKTPGKTEVRIDQTNIEKLSDLAKKTPLQIITPKSHEILERGPEYRRRFLEWGVFHVEPQFQRIYSRFYKALAQRNSALKQKSSSVSAWNNEIIQMGDKLSDARNRYFQLFLEEVKRELSFFLENDDVYFAWKQGWPENKTLADSIRENTVKDMERGFTREGPHRADIIIKYNGGNVSLTASRGQQKIITAAMQIAQSVLTKTVTGKSPIFLIDDLTSELDQNNRDKLISRLEQLKYQTFITGTDPLLHSTMKMFHVKHGSL